MGKQTKVIKGDLVIKSCDPIVLLSIHTFSVTRVTPNIWSTVTGLGTIGVGIDSSNGGVSMSNLRSITSRF